jgi:hypothetical protein
MCNQKGHTAKKIFGAALASNSNNFTACKAQDSLKRPERAPAAENFNSIVASLSYCLDRSCRASLTPCSNEAGTRLPPDVVKTDSCNHAQNGAELKK